MYPDLSKMAKEESTSNSSNISQSFISLEIAEKMLLRFDGTKSKLFDFIDNCDNAINLIKPELKNILFAIIVSKITDNAKALIRNRDFESWIELKTYLLEIYAEKRTIGQRQLELTSCKQNIGENVISYSNKIENCYIKLINSLDPKLPQVARQACIDLLKNEALNVFITGLNKDLNILVKSQNPDSLEKAISVALNEEQELKSKQEMQRYQSINNSSARLCFNCNKPGHTSINCRFKKNENSNIRVFSHNQNTKFCRYCKKPGHLLEDCRKREYNNKNRLQNQYPRHTNHSPQSSHSNSYSNRNQNNNLNPNAKSFSSTNNQDLNSNKPRQSTAVAREIHLIKAESQ